MIKYTLGGMDNHHRPVWDHTIQPFGIFVKQTDTSVAGRGADFIFLSLDDVAIFIPGYTVKQVLFVDANPIAGAFLKTGRVEVVPSFLK